MLGRSTRSSRLWRSQALWKTRVSRAFTCLTKELGGGYDDVAFELYLLRNGQPYLCGGSPVQLRHEQAPERLATVEQRFLLLPTGGLIGLHTWLRTTSCVPGIPALPPGKYEVSAANSGVGGCVPDLSNKRTQLQAFTLITRSMRVMATFYQTVPPIRTGVTKYPWAHLQMRCHSPRKLGPGRKLSQWPHRARGPAALSAGHFRGPRLSSRAGCVS